MIEFSAVSKEATAYINGEDLPRKLEEVENEVNYFDNFIEAVFDEKERKRYNSQIFASTEQTLLVQKAAD